MTQMITGCPAPSGGGPGRRDGVAGRRRPRRRPLVGREAPSGGRSPGSRPRLASRHARPARGPSVDRPALPVAAPAAQAAPSWNSPTTAAAPAWNLPTAALRGLTPPARRRSRSSCRPDTTRPRAACRRRALSAASRPTRRRPARSVGPPPIPPPTTARYNAGAAVDSRCTGPFLDGLQRVVQLRLAPQHEQRRVVQERLLLRRQHDFAGDQSVLLHRPAAHDGDRTAVHHPNGAEGQRRRQRRVLRHSGEFGPVANGSRWS